MSNAPVLPADILRKVILYADHSIGEMRRVSTIYFYFVYAITSLITGLAPQGRNIRPIHFAFNTS